MTLENESNAIKLATFGEFTTKHLTYGQCMNAIGFRGSLASFEALISVSILEFGRPIPLDRAFTFVQLQELYRNWQTLAAQNRIQLENLF